jgi:PAS domain S-box-containing protein
MDSLLDTAPCGFLTFADDGAILMVNSTLLEWLGVEQGELEGRHIESILPISSRIFYQSYFFPLLTLHGRADEIYLSLRGRSGDEIPVLVNAARTQRNGMMVNDCVIVPMRQRRRFEDEILLAKKSAEEASQAKAKFLSTMSHEIRTPLQAIAGYVDIIAEGIHGPVTEPQLDDLRHITSAIQFLLGLINDILNLARLEAGKIDLRLKSVRVAEIFTAVEGLVQHRIRERDLQYRREECGTELEVRADPERLQQILLNFLGNAIKFTGTGGCIALGCRRAGDRASMYVRDSGRGIPPDQIERIFEPFVQVNRQPVELSRQGAGLGLAISRELAHAMGGEITVESTVGEGSIFTITLPIVG